MLEGMVPRQPAGLQTPHMLKRSKTQQLLLLQSLQHVKLPTEEAK